MPSRAAPLACRAAAACPLTVAGSLGVGAVGTVGLIILNVALMMCDSYPYDAQRHALLERSNLLLSLCFALEMLLKHVACTRQEPLPLLPSPLPLLLHC